ncbi:zonular occludens toxin domain-containing protein, partial [Escherichia coli]
ELWSIWPSDSKLSEAHKRFISMHRHMTHAVSGVSCDLVIINQGVDGVPRYLKERIESTYRMTKLKSLGLSKSYRVDVFSGAKVFKNNKVSTR